MIKATVAVLALLFGLCFPAAADPSSDWIRTVIETTQSLARHPDPKRVATGYVQRLMVRFEIDHGGQVRRVTVQRKRPTRQAAGFAPTRA